jgi:hypothetical protein
VSGEVPKPEPREREPAALLARVIGEGESPAWWGIPVGSIGGCRVRVHLVTPVYVLAAVAHAVWNDLGIPFVVMGLGALACAVALHEAARAHALVRGARLRPIDVTLWPLGAVWRFHDEDSTRAEGAGALVALAATAGLAAILAGLVVAVIPDGPALLLDLFRPSLALGQLSPPKGALWQAYAMSLYVLLANCLPMLPLDAAVALRAVDLHPHAAGVRAPAHELGVVMRARRVAASREVDRLEDVRLPRAVRADECGDAATEWEPDLRV